MTTLDTFLAHCADMQRTAKTIMAEQGCPAVLAVVKPAPPTLLGRDKRCPVMFAAIGSMDIPLLMDVLFGLPPKSGMGVFR